MGRVDAGVDEADGDALAGQRAAVGAGEGGQASSPRVAVLEVSAVKRDRLVALEVGDAGLGAGRLDLRFGAAGDDDADPVEGGRGRQAAGAAPPAWRRRGRCRARARWPCRAGRACRAGRPGSPAPGAGLAGGARAGRGRDGGQGDAAAASSGGDARLARVVRKGRRMQCPPGGVAPGVRPVSQALNGASREKVTHRVPDRRALELRAWRPSTPGEPDALAADVAERFPSRHGRGPVGVFAAPGRVNLIGEHVDYNGGLCLPMALPHATYAAVGLRDDERGHACAAASRTTSFSGRWTPSARVRRPAGRRTPAGCCGRCARTAGTCPAWTCVVDSRVPLGAGLSSSAALECAVALGGRRRRSAPTSTTTLRGRLWCGPACAPSGRSPAPRPAAWTRRSSLFGRAGVGAAARLPRLVDAAGRAGTRRPPG